MWKRQRRSLTGLGSVTVTALLLTGSASAQMEDTSSPPKEIDGAVWKEHFPEQRVMFGISPDGTVTTFVNSARDPDPGGYPMEEIKLRTIAIEIGGTNTKVCWTSGGDKHCDPPPPP